jgi:caspase 2
MLKRDRFAIKRNFVVLVKELPCQEILAHLYQDGILSDHMVEEILEQPATNRNYFLLLLLPRRGPTAFSSFTKALRAVKRSDLANVLTDFEDDFSKLSIKD